MMTRARQLDPTILAKVLTKAREVKGAVVVFDLDSTLLDNRPRQAQILREFGAAHGVAALAAARPEHWDSWDLKRAMLNTGAAPADVERLVEEGKRFWKE